MNNLVFSNNGQVVTNSLLVAEKFEKRHSDVIRAIESHFSGLKSTNANLRWFEESEYYDAKGESRKMYLMNRDGFSFTIPNVY